MVLKDQKQLPAPSRRALISKRLTGVEHQPGESLVAKLL